MSTNSWDPADANLLQLSTRVLNSQPTAWLSNQTGGVDLFTACPAQSLPLTTGTGGVIELLSGQNRQTVALRNFTVARAGFYLIVIPNLSMGFLFSDGINNVFYAVLLLNVGGQIHATSNNQMYNDLGTPSILTSQNGSLMMMAYLNTGTRQRLGRDGCETI